MKSQRLTKQIKETIIKAMNNEFFTPRYEAANKLLIELADKIYDSFYTPERQKYMKNAPEGAFQYTDSLSVRFPDNYGSYGSYRAMSKARPFFAADCNRTLRFDVGDPITVERDKIRDIKKCINNDKAKLESSTWAILNSATTIKKLLEIWPEVACYLPEENVAENLPALPVGDLNDMISRLKVNMEMAA